MRHDRLTELRALAATIHHGQVDHAGKPYIDHIDAVTAAVSGPAKPVAIFHDAIEDHPDSLAVVESVLSIVELTAVLLLRRRRTDTYRDYIERIATWPGRVGELGREVKRADAQHNLRPTPGLERLRPRYEYVLDRLG